MKKLCDSKFYFFFKRYVQILEAIKGSGNYDYVYKSKEYKGKSNYTKPPRPSFKSTLISKLNQAMG